MLHGDDQAARARQREAADPAGCGEALVRAGRRVEAVHLAGRDVGPPEPCSGRIPDGALGALGLGVEHEIGCHPLIAPAVMPWIRKRRTSIEKTRTGSITMAPPAAILPQAQPS